jgi:hypothetical protein
VDSLVAATPDLQKRWRELNRTLSDYVRKKKDPAAAPAQGPVVARALGAGALAVMRASCRDVPLGKQFGSLFSGSQNMRSSAGFVGLTILAADDGMVLRDDWVRREKTIKIDALRGIVADFEKRLP